MSTAVNGGEAAIGGQRVELDAAPFLLPACGPPDPDTSTRGPSDFAATPGESEDEPEPRPKPRRSDCLPDALRGHDVLPADADRPEDLVGPPHGHDTCPKPPAGIFTVYGLGMDEGNTYVDDPHCDLERRAKRGRAAASGATPRNSNTSRFNTLLAGSLSTASATLPHAGLAHRRFVGGR